VYAAGTAVAAGAAVDAAVEPEGELRAVAVGADLWPSTLWREGFEPSPLALICGRRRCGGRAQSRRRRCRVVAADWTHWSHSTAAAFSDLMLLRRSRSLGKARRSTKPSSLCASRQCIHWLARLISARWN
jgi:hypothetical protein